MAAEKNKKEERALRRLGIEPAAIGEVAYKIIRADLQAARELYRILVAGGGDAAGCFVREFAAGLENERKTTPVRMQQAQIEVADAQAKKERKSTPLQPTHPIHNAAVVFLATQNP